MCAVEGTCADNLLEQVEGLVVHRDNVVGIPTYRTAGVEHQLRHEEKEGSDHVADVLGLLVVACVKGVHKLAGRAVAGHEVV